MLTSRISKASTSFWVRWRSSSPKAKMSLWPEVGTAHHDHIDIRSGSGFSPGIGAEQQGVLGVIFVQQLPG